MQKAKNVVIIGAGFGGLSAACRLAKLGYKVKVLEKNNQVGGKASELILDGFRFDRGPSFMTMLNVYEDLFTFCGYKFADFIELTSLDKTVRYYFSDNQILDTYNILEKNLQVLSKELQEDIQNLKTYFELIQKIYQYSYPIALDKVFNFNSIFSYKLIKQIWPDISNVTFSSLNTLHKKILKNPKTIAIFNRWAAYVYSHPKKLPAMLCSIAWAEQGLGLYLPKNGIYGISKALENLTKKLGVEIVTNVNIQKITQHANKIWQIDYTKFNENLSYTLNLASKQELVSNQEKEIPLFPKGWTQSGRGTPNHQEIYTQTLIANDERHILTDSQNTNSKLAKLKYPAWHSLPHLLERGIKSIKTDILISNVDKYQFHNLYLTRKFLPQKRGGSYIIFYLGIKYHPCFENLALHNIFFTSTNYLQEYDQNYYQNKVPEKPAIYLNITSQLIPSDAPILDGKQSQNWIVIFNVPPNNSKIDWQSEATRLQKYAFENIEKQLKMPSGSLQDLVVVQKIVMPKDIQTWTGSYNGDLASWNIGSTLDLLQRPNCKSKDYDNLYFVGGTINPGPGMPMAILSGKHCVDMVEACSI